MEIANDAGRERLHQEREVSMWHTGVPLMGKSM